MGIWIDFEVYDSISEKRFYIFEYVEQEGEQPVAKLIFYLKSSLKGLEWKLAECYHWESMNRRTIPSEFVPIGAFEIQKLSEGIMKAKCKEGWLKGLGSLWPPTRVYDAVLSQFL